MLIASKSAFKDFLVWYNNLDVVQQQKRSMLTASKSTFKDFLVWYNNLDVVPFLEAVEKMSQIWQERKIDMFKDGISVPGLSLKYLFSYLLRQISVCSTKPTKICTI